MNQALKQNFDRILAARERLLEIRAERVSTIMRVQSYLRARLDDFFTNVDPISGSRLADLGAEGSKGAGEMALILAMFDGSRMRISVDGSGRFSHDAEPNVFEGIDEILDFDVSPDFASASFDYIPAGSTTGRPARVSLDGFVDRLVQNTLETIEAAVAPGQTLAPSPVAASPVMAPPLAAVQAAPPLQAAPPPTPLQSAPPPATLQSVLEYEVPRIARAVVEEAPSRLEAAPAPVYQIEEPAGAPAYRSELPRLETAPDPVRYSEKVRPLERPRPMEYDREMDRIAQSNGSPVSGLPLKPRGLSFSVR